MVPAVLALLLAASPVEKVPRVAHVEPPGPAPITLAGVDDLVALCQRLTPVERLRPKGDRVDQGERLEAHAAARDEAITGRYALTVPGAQLAFSPYDGPERTLSVAEPAAVTLRGGPRRGEDAGPARRGAAGGAGGAVMRGGAKKEPEPPTVRLWATEDRTLPVEIDAAGARRILAAQRAGTLSLRLLFDLPDDATCGSDVRGRRFALGVEPVDWTWLDGDAVLAHGSASADLPAVSVAQGAVPRVDVGEPISGPSEAKKAVLAYRGELLACYWHALAQEPALDGLVVVDLGPRVGVSADSTGSGDLTGCVERTLAPLAAESRSSVPIRFELAAPGSKAEAIPAAGDVEGKGTGP